METTYYDTADLRLARWGCNLRFRSGEGWTVKLPSEGAAVGLERFEQVFEGPATSPPKAALALLQAYLRGTRPQRVAHLSTLRQRVRLETAEGRSLAEVLDDEVSVLEDRRVAARFREVEVELAEGSPDGDGLREAVRRKLVAAGARAGDQTPKLVRALGARAAARPEVAADDLPRKASAGELLGHAIQVAVADLLRHDPGVRLGSDPEAVHQARVAVRTLRSHLRAFGRLLAEKPAHADELRALADRLGEVRDREVLLELLRSQIGKLPSVDGRAGPALLEVLEAEIASAKKRLAALMDSPGYPRLLESLVALARSPKFNELGALPAREVAVELARRPWRRLRKAVQALPEEPGNDQLHRIRILAKRTRYAAEAVAPVAGRRAERFALAAEQLQTVLGDFHDAVVAEDWLRSHAGSGRRAFLAGQLTANLRARAASLRARWPAAWDSLNRKRLREWFNT